MLSNVSPNQNDKGETSKVYRDKPQTPPRNDHFRKLYKKENRSPREPKDEEELNVEEQEQDSSSPPRPSLFDLPKKTAPKSTSSSFTKQPALKDSSFSELAETQPLFQQEEGESQELDAFIGKQHSQDEEIESDTLPPQPSPKENPFLETAPVSELPPEEIVDVPQPMEPSKPKISVEGKKSPDQTQTADALRRQAPGHPLLRPLKKPEISTFETKESEPVVKKDKSKSESRMGSRLESEKVNPTIVNPEIQSVAFQTEKMEETQEDPLVTIRSIATQIVDRIQIMRKEDQTSTIMTLSHPPLLEGATITLTSSDLAKREFNISFANLSPDAKLMLDRKLNEDSLSETLERKGIIVHMITTSTQPELVLNIESSQASRDQQQRDQQRDQQQQQQKRQQFEEEET